MTRRKKGGVNPREEEVDRCGTGRWSSTGRRKVKGPCVPETADTSVKGRWNGGWGICDS